MALSPYLSYNPAPDTFLLNLLHAQILYITNNKQQERT